MSRQQAARASHQCTAAGLSCCCPCTAGLLPKREAQQPTHLDSGAPVLPAVIAGRRLHMRACRPVNGRLDDCAAQCTAGAMRCCIRVVILPSAHASTGRQPGASVQTTRQPGASAGQLGSQAQLGAHLQPPFAAPASYQPPPRPPPPRRGQTGRPGRQMRRRSWQPLQGRRNPPTQRPGSTAVAAIEQTKPHFESPPWPASVQAQPISRLHPL